METLRNLCKELNALKLSTIDDVKSHMNGLGMTLMNEGRNDVDGKRPGDFAEFYAGRSNGRNHVIAWNEKGVDKGFTWSA